MIEQIPVGRVAGRIEQAAHENRGLVLGPDEVGAVAGLPGAAERIREAASRGATVRATAADVAAVMTEEIEEVARLMREERWHRAATGKAHADRVLEAGGVSTRRSARSTSCKSRTWKFVTAMSWRGC